MVGGTREEDDETSGWGESRIVVEKTHGMKMGMLMLTLKEKKKRMGVRPEKSSLTLTSR